MGRVYSNSEQEMMRSAISSKSDCFDEIVEVPQMRTACPSCQLDSDRGVSSWSYWKQSAEVSDILELHLSLYTSALVGLLTHMPASFQSDHTTEDTQQGSLRRHSSFQTEASRV